MTIKYGTGEDEVAVGNLQYGELSKKVHIQLESPLGKWHGIITDKGKRLDGDITRDGKKLLLIGRRGR